MNLSEPKRAQDLQQGMQFVAEWGEVMPGAAGERVAAVYDDIRRSLRVPFVNFIFRVLANDPDVLEALWSRSAPGVRSVAFEAAADRLRAQALLDPVPDSSSVDWEAVGDLGQIRPFTDAIHYVLPKLLLIATAWQEGLDLSGRAAAGRASGRFPASVAGRAKRIEMVRPEDATGRLKELFADIQQTHEHPGVASYYRALAQWPPFLAAAWNRIRPRIGSPAYQQRKQGLVAEALRAARELAQDVSSEDVSSAAPLEDPLRKCAVTSAWRRSVSGRTLRSFAPRRACSGSSRWWP